MSSLTETQRLVLAYMLVANWVCYNDRNDRTQLALKRRGLVEYRVGGKYGRPHWGLTEAGLAEARKRRDAGRTIK